LNYRSATGAPPQTQTFCPYSGSRESTFRARLRDAGEAHFRAPPRAHKAAPQGGQLVPFLWPVAERILRQRVKTQNQNQKNIFEKKKIAMFQNDYNK